MSLEAVGTSVPATTTALTLKLGTEGSHLNIFLL